MNKEQQKKLLEADAKDGLYKPQTSLEWFAEQIKDYDCAPVSNFENYAIAIPVWVFKDKLEQAQAMYQEEMLNRFGQGYEEGMYDALYK